MARFDSRGGHPWFAHRVFYLFDLIWWFCEQLMCSREEIRVRASCYDNKQYANSKYTYTWDHLLCQKATLFRELGINSIVPSIWRSCLASSRALLFTSWDEWRRNSGKAMAFYIMFIYASDMFRTKLLDTWMLFASIFRRFAGWNCTGVWQGEEGALKRAMLLPFADFAKRDKRQNVCCYCWYRKSTPQPYALGALRLKRRLVGWVISWFSFGFSAGLFVSLSVGLLMVWSVQYWKRLSSIGSVLM